MAIKNKQRRDTYRSNVKERPLRQNGLEAQYQGLDIKEINIDHSGLPIIGRGGFQNRQRYTKVQKEYVVDVSEETYHPSATIVFGHRADLWQFDTTNPPTRGLADDFNNVELPIASPSAAAKTYKFYKTPPSGKTTGDLDSANKIVVDMSGIPLEDSSLLSLLNELTGAIESGNGHGKNVFTFSFGPTDISAISGTPNPLASAVELPSNSIKLKLNATNIGNPAAAVGTPTGIPYASSNQASFTITNFQNIDGAREWALNGYKELEIDSKFYEDIRVDLLQVGVLHDRKHSDFKNAETFDNAGNTLTYPRFGAGLQTFKTNWLGLGVGSPIIDLDGVLSGSAGSGNTADPTGSGYTLNPYHPTDVHKKLSEEVRIRSIPLRDPILGQHREDNQVKWYEDPYWKDVNERTWTNMQERFSLYHATFLQHIAGDNTESNPGIIDGVYYRVADIPEEPLSGRIDTGLRVSRTLYALPSPLATEQHPFSFLNQYLEEIKDKSNVHDNSFPIADRTQADLPYEDNLGKRVDSWKGTYAALAGPNPFFPENYFDQPAIETHNYTDSPVYYSSIDREMRTILTAEEWDHDNNSSTAMVDLKRTVIIDERELQDSQDVITATGFINSQSTRQSGIVYRELLR